MMLFKKNEDTEENDYFKTLESGLQEDLRTIYVMGEIEERQAFHFISALKYLDRTDGDIRVILASVGGDEQYGYAMYDAMRMTKNTIIVEGYGIVASMAAVIFQGADIRKISSNCDYMIHNGSLTGISEEEAQDTVIKMAERVKVNNNKYYQILFDNSDLTWEEIEKYCSAETYFSSKEAVEHGLADCIIKPNKTIIRKKRKNRKKGK